METNSIPLSNEQIIDLIKNQNIDQLNRQDELGFTPLHLVIERQQIDIIAQLLSLGVATDIKTSKGHNAKEMAESFIMFFSKNFSEQKLIIKRYEEILEMIKKSE